MEPAVHAGSGTATGPDPDTDGAGDDDHARVLREILAAIAGEMEWTEAERRAAQAGPDASLRDDLGLDSLHLVAVQVLIEDRFAIAFDPADEQLADAFDTVGSLARYVEHLLQENA